MNFRAVLFYVGHILKLESLFMFPALIISVFMREERSTTAFLITIIITFFVGMIFVSFKQHKKNIYAREGFITVSLGWIAMSLFGALPFLLSGAIPSAVDCWFETVSGFTTTGASILTEVEALPYSMLYWRSFTHWLGGMGVLVFILAVVPQSKGNGETLYLLRAESPGPEVGKLKPTMRRTALTLYSIYIVLTLVEFILLLFGGMPVFDSLVNSFATAGTGGFAIKNASIAAYDSSYLQAVIGIFMMLFGVNFSMFYLILAKQFKAVLKNEEFRLYIGIMFASTLAITINILPMYSGIGKALLDGFFQVSSIMTTTGFATADFDLWPEFSRYLLVVLMLFGASAGSTGGGIKTARIIILWKSMKNEVLKVVRPRAVRPVIMDGRVLPNEVVIQTHTFMTAYFAICLISMGLISFDNLSLETTISSVIACINNIGPGLHLIGPTGNYSIFSNASKLILSANMLLGRLEIFPLFMLFSPSVWHIQNRQINFQPRSI